MSKRPADPIAWERTLPIRQSSPAWVAAVRAIYGTLQPADLPMFETIAGGIEPPVGGATDVLIVAGRRGGKSETIARLATFECVYGGHEVALAPGQVGLFAVISPTKEQSQEILNFARGLASLSAVKRHVQSITTRGVLFRNGLEIRVVVCDDVAVSGPTLVGCVADEFAKWPGQESGTPDTAILKSLRPALAPLRGAPPRRFIGITSAFLDEGVAYETDTACYGVEGAPTLVMRGTTEQFNPNISAGWLAGERKDLSAFEREYLSIWKSGITTGWFGDENISQCIETGRQRSTFRAGFEYVAAIDAAFRVDTFALAIGHGEADGFARLDRVCAWTPTSGAPLNVDETIGNVCRVMKGYGLTTALADQFSIAPLAALFRQRGVHLREIAWTPKSKPERFWRVRDGLAAKTISLVDDGPTIREFRAIQQRVLRTGGEQFEAKRGHDDRVHAAVMALSEILQSASRPGHGQSMLDLMRVDDEVYAERDTAGWPAPDADDDDFGITHWD